VFQNAAMNGAANDNTLLITGVPSLPNTVAEA
jgi:hypothetical protein